MSSRRELFERDGMLRAFADGPSIDVLAGTACERDVGNEQPLRGWEGAPRAPFSARVRRAHLSLAHARAIWSIFYESEAARTLADCIGAPFVIASARVFATPAHAGDDPGLSPLFLPAPAGIVRTITFLHDLDHTSSPFELRAVRENDEPSTRRGTMVLFDASRVQWKERTPLRGERRVLDAVALPRDAAPQVWLTGMNYWPLDAAAQYEGFAVFLPQAAP